MLQRQGLSFLEGVHATRVSQSDCLVSCARLMVINRGLRDREKKKRQLLTVRDALSIKKNKEQRNTVHLGLISLIFLAQNN